MKTGNKSNYHASLSQVFTQLSINNLLHASWSTFGSPSKEMAYELQVPKTAHVVDRVPFAQNAAYVCGLHFIILQAVVHIVYGEGS